MSEREDNPLRTPPGPPPRGKGTGGDEVGKAGGYFVCHCKDFENYHENDWKILRGFKPQCESKLGFEGTHFTKHLEEEQSLLMPGHTVDVINS